MTGQSLPRPAGRGLGARMLDGISSIWCGVVLAILLFIYCSIGSAVPAVRQHPALEMTEFEWFHWWPFSVLMALFAVSLVLATVRRVPLRWVNAGVWMIHTGIIILILGSYYYFGTKVEGDAPVFRRRVTINMPNMAEPASLPALPGAETDVVAGPDLWHFKIQSTNSAWPILSEEHKGETAYAVNVMVQPPTGKAFIRQLLAGYKQYTEDIIPGQGRAIKSLGRKLVDADLSLTLDYEPQKYFHVMDSWALFVRRAGDRTWVERPIQNLPRYHDRIGSRELVFVDPNNDVPLRAIDLDVPAASDGDPLSGARVRVTGYLRYAQMQRRWRDGGSRLNPVLHMSALSSQGEEQSYELVAFDPTQSFAESGLIQFVWLDDASEVAQLPEDSRPILHVEVPAAEVTFDLPLTRELVAGREGSFRKIDDTDYAYRVLSLQDNLVLPGARGNVSIAMVEIKTPDETFTRMVADDPSMTRDMRGDTNDPHMPHGRTPEPADERIVMTYQPQTAPVIVAAHPNGLHFIYNGLKGRQIERQVRVGDLVQIIPGFQLRLDDLWLHATAEVKPYIVPKAARRRDAGVANAKIRLEVDAGRGAQTLWLPFHQYVFPNEEYSYAGRFPFSPTSIRGPDGRQIELIFSRQRRRLPYPIALEDFALDTHLGGYSGSASTIRNYVSQLRFFDDGRWTKPEQIAVNSPTEYGGFWYFQSTWDPPPRGQAGAGMNFTGLGVGNRNGVYVQLFGCCLAVLGMLFAFYYKPILKRRRNQGARASADQFETAPSREESSVETMAAVEV